jgi:hypothetical protein
MENWFEVKVAYEKLQEDGLYKKATELFLFDALSWAEAEVRTVEELKPYISGEFDIVAMRRVKFAELFLSDVSVEAFFRAKIQFVSLDEKSGKEKRTNTYMLAQADDIDKAQEVIKEGMKGTMSDYVIAEVKETKIMGVFPYNDDEKSDH